MSAAQSINPRMAAFLASHGRDQTYDVAVSFSRAHSNAGFMAFIARAKRTAAKWIVWNDRVVDQDAFTAHCWNVARDDLLGRFPA